MMKECKKCNEMKPDTTEFFDSNKGRTTGRCKKCTSEYNKNYGQLNKEKLLSQKKAYYQSNKDRLAEYSKSYREANKEYIKEWRKNHYQENHSLINEKNAQYRANNAEKMKEYFRNHYQMNKGSIKRRVKLYFSTDAGRETSKKTRQKRRTIKRGLDATLTHQQWEECKANFENCCAYCGKEAKLEQDHFLPLSRRGEYTLNNIIPSCRTCNSSKSDRDYFDWYPKQNFYTKKRDQKILLYLGYEKETRLQQLALL